MAESVRVPVVVVVALVTVVKTNRDNPKVSPYLLPEFTEEGQRAFTLFTIA
jgi:hypothetical protein